MTQRLLAILRITIGAILVVAAVLKLGDIEAFAEEVANYRMVPAFAVPYFVCALLGSEIVAGAALLLGWKSRAAALLASMLLAGFTIAIAQALLRGIDTRCGCFGGTEMASWGSVGRDVVLLGMSLAVLALGPGALMHRGPTAKDS